MNFDGQWHSIYCKENTTICSTEKHQIGLQRKRSPMVWSIWGKISRICEDHRVF